MGETGEIVSRSVPVTNKVENFRKTRHGNVGFHCGNLARLREALPKMELAFGKMQVVDRRSETPMGVEVTMVNPTRYNQEGCYGEFLASGGGLVQAPTSWGKTFFGIMTAARLGLRTLVLMSKTNWIEGWIRDFYEHTNGHDIEEKIGRPLVGRINNSFEEGDLFPCINFATFQTFFSKSGHKARKRLRHSFGLVIADEVVELPALKTSQVFTSFAPKWRMGLSADEERKDKRHKLTYDYCGPVIAKGHFTGGQKSAEVLIHDPGIEINTQYLYGHWFGALCTQVSRRNQLNQMLVANIIKDVLDGYKVLVLVDRRNHALALAGQLRKEVILIPKHEYRKKRKGDDRRPIKQRTLKVEHLMGGDKQQPHKIEAAGRGDFDVFVAMDRCIGKNTDLPRLDSLHDPSPTNNLQITKQRTGRVLRDLCKCRKCKVVHKKRVDVCESCGSSDIRSLKKVPRIHIYKISAYPENTAPARMLMAGWATRMRFYREKNFLIENDEPEARMKTGRQLGHIKRKK